MDNMNKHASSLQCSRFSFLEAPLLPHQETQLLGMVLVTFLAGGLKGFFQALLQLCLLVNSPSRVDP